MEQGKALVIESIEVSNLGKRSETEHVSSQNPLLKFEIGKEVYKTETKKHVKTNVQFQDSIRFQKLSGDVLTVIAIAACSVGLSK